MNLEFTLLEENQIFGKNQLEILKKYGTKCAITDYAILKGGYVANGIFINDEKSLKNRIGYWWTKTPYEGYVRAVNVYGDCYWDSLTNSRGGIRPALPYSLIKSIIANEVREANGILTGEFAWYPGEIAPKNLREELEQLYQTKDLKEYQCESYTWFEHNGKRYTRVKPENSANDETLSDGTTVIPSNYYWVKVEPIKILIDEEKDIALFEKIVFSGIPFKSDGRYEGNFDNTDIGKYLKEVFAHDIEKSLIFKDEEEIQKQNQDSIEELLLTQRQILEKLRNQDREIEEIKDNQRELIRILKH